MKKILCLCFNALQSIALIAAEQSQDTLSLFIKNNDWPAVNELFNCTNPPTITDQHISQARLADCSAEKKCWRTCACVFLPIIGFMSRSYLNDNSYMTTFIDRGSGSAFAISAERLFVHGQAKNFFNARRILLFLQQKQTPPV